jgi:hypothetical protein
MDQIITLLSNLFNLTKVASVTLPGLALAGALALFLWPSRPIDIVRIPIIVEPAGEPVVAQKPCSNLPVLERGNDFRPCLPGESPGYLVRERTSSNRSLRPSCELTSVYLNLFEEVHNFSGRAPEEILVLCGTLAKHEPRSAISADSANSDVELRQEVKAWCGTYGFYDPAKNDKKVNLLRSVGDSEKIPGTQVLLEKACSNVGNATPPPSEELTATLIAVCLPQRWIARWPFGADESRALVGLVRPNGAQLSEVGRGSLRETLEVRDALQNIATSYQGLPPQPKVVRQFVLDKTKDLLTRCNGLETALQGQEQADNTELTTDIANLDKQRSDLQDAYTASLKTNDRVISENFRRKLSAILELSDEYRARSGVNLASINERTRRLDEIKVEQANVAALLVAPGSLRAVQGFDTFIQGLVNHVIAFILLSIALSLILVAFDRTVVGNLFEDVFPGW